MRQSREMSILISDKIMQDLYFTYIHIWHTPKMPKLFLDEIGSEINKTAIAGICTAWSLTSFSQIFNSVSSRRAALTKKFENSL